jgi:hypothetical protein
VIEIVVTVAALIIAGVLGARVSVAVRAGEIGAWASVAIGQMSVIIWALQARSHSMTLVQASVLFDVVYTASWFTAYWVFGESITPVQLGGLSFLLLGLVLVNL